jgi:hypothetical protein
VVWVPSLTPTRRITPRRHADTISPVPEVHHIILIIQLVDLIRSHRPPLSHRPPIMLVVAVPPSLPAMIASTMPHSSPPPFFSPILCQHFAPLTLPLSYLPLLCYFHPSTSIFTTSKPQHHSRAATFFTTILTAIFTITTIFTASLNLVL